MTSKPIICIPEKDTTKRFLLGKKGTKELLAIALNPSTANEIILDPTSRNIETLALQNQCDGWYLVNLYPLRSSHPSMLPEINDSNMMNDNLVFIENMLKSKNYKVDKVLVCWGDNILYKEYLNIAAVAILELMAKYKIEPYCMALTGLRNPYHPMPTPVNRYLGGILKVKLKVFKDELLKINE